jgi:DNA-binding transcriptional regulator GbsR (MarR family)
MRLISAKSFPQISKHFNRKTPLATLNRTITVTKAANQEKSDWSERSMFVAAAPQKLVQMELNNRGWLLQCATMNLPPDGPPTDLSALERGVLDVFVDGVRVLGLPRSIGEIYGLLFISRSPLSLDDLVARLNISKGSASQGLRMLKSLGAVNEANGNGNGGTERRTYYEPAVELKRLVGGFIREQIRPHLNSGKTKIGRLAESADEVHDPEHRQFLRERVERLEQWMRSGGRVLPIVQKILGQ